MVEFRINQKLSISLATEKCDFHSTKIQEISSNMIGVNLPFIRNIPLRSNKGDALVGRYMQEDAVYEFHSKVLGVRMSGKIPLLVFEKPVEVRRTQKRDFFRQDCLLPLEYSFASSISRDFSYLPSIQNFAVPWYKGTIIDISGGGLRFAADRPVPPGAELVVRFTLGSQRSGNRIESVGKVIRIEEKRAPDGKHYCSISFVNMSESTQDVIVNYVFSISGSKKR